MIWSIIKDFFKLIADRHVQNELDKRISQDNYSLQNDGFIITHNSNVATVPYFVGRTDITGTIRNSIQKHLQCILVSGMVGIGKTQICKNLYIDYVNRHFKKEKLPIEHIGYMAYHTDINKTLCNNLIFTKSYNYMANVKTAWKTLANICSKGKTLLIIDNVSDVSKDSNFTKLFSLNAYIVITSMEKTIRNFKTIHVDVLEYKHCKQLFESIYGEVASGEEEALYTVIEKVAYKHTLTLDMLAHLAKTKNWAIRTLLEKLNENDFNFSYYRNGEVLNLQKCYETIFNLNEFSKSEKNILEAFSLFPYKLLDAETCNYWLSGDAGVSKDSLIINSLYNKGWLENDKLGFRLHPLMSQVIYKLQKPQIKNHMLLSKRIIESISRCDEAGDARISLYLEFGEEVARKLFQNNSEIAFLCRQLAYVFSNRRDIHAAYMWYSRALNISTTLYGTNHYKVAAVYEEMGDFYLKQADNQNAMSYYMKSFLINKRLFGMRQRLTVQSIEKMEKAYVPPAATPSLDFDSWFDQLLIKSKRGRK